MDDSAGVYLVPAFTGLGTPYWDSSARGVMVGLTRGVNKGHIARAALESIAFQCADVIEVMGEESGISLDSVRVDGGASKNTLLMEFQANISQSLIERPVNIETTVLGAAFLSGIGSGLWLDKEEVRRMIRDRYQDATWDFPETAEVPHQRVADKHPLPYEYNK